MSHMETNDKLLDMFPGLGDFLKNLGFSEDPSESSRWAFKYKLTEPDHYFEAKFFLGRPMEHGGVNLTAAISYLGHNLLNIDNKGSLGLSNVQEPVIDALQRISDIFKAIKFQVAAEPNVGTRLSNLKKELS